MWSSHKDHILRGARFKIGFASMASSLLLRIHAITVLVLPVRYFLLLTPQEVTKKEGAQISCPADTLTAE